MARGHAEVYLTVAFQRGCKTRTAWSSDTNVITMESGCLRMQPKVGGKLHLSLNINTSPIANKYREGKLKRTLKREFNST